jgi:hypothetical protein
MSLWKRKLGVVMADALVANLSPTAKDTTPCEVDCSKPALIPVVVTDAAPALTQPSRAKPQALVKSSRLPGADLSLSVRLPNGVSIGVELTSTAGLPALLRELARLPC